MAKKKKAKKAKAKAKKAVPSVTPTYLPAGQTYTLGLHDVVRALKVIDKHGHTAKFVKAAKAAKAGGTFDADTVNFVKDFMAKQKLHTDPVGKHIVNAQGAPERGAMRGGGSFNCNFGGGG